MVRFMLIVFILNQIEDIIDFDEIIYLERGQNLFEIYVQKVRNFFDNIVFCRYFLYLKLVEYYFVNIQFFIDFIIL